MCPPFDHPMSFRPENKSRHPPVHDLRSISTRETVISETIILQVLEGELLVAAICRNNCDSEGLSLVVACLAIIKAAILRVLPRGCHVAQEVYFSCKERGNIPTSMSQVWMVSSRGIAAGAFPIDPISCVVAMRVATDAEIRKKPNRTTRKVLKGFSTSARNERYF